MKGTVLYSAPTKVRKTKLVYTASKMECDTASGLSTETFQQQALEIREPGADFDPNAEPVNGEEFLMRMLLERKQCPSVVVRRPKHCAEYSDATADTNSAPTQKAATDFNTSAALLPTVEWKLAQEADFQATRSRIAQLRQELLAQQYDNNLEPPLTTDSAEWQQFCRVQQPLLSTILRLNQRTLEQLLEMLSEWLQCDEELNEVEIEQELLPAASSSAAAIVAPTTVDLSGNEQWLGTWLYAALACLHLPLEPDVHSTLRDIARSCIRLRNRLQALELEKAAPYNLFIYLIAKVFGQLDFAEFV